MVNRMKKEPPPNREGKQEGGSLAKSPNWTHIFIFALIWILILYIVGGSLTGPATGSQIPYSAFRNQLREGMVTEITVQGETIRGTFRQPVEVLVGPPGEAEKVELNSFHTIMPTFGDPDLMQLLDEQKVTIRTEEPRSNWFGTLLLYMIPWILIIGFFIYASRKMQQVGGGGMGGKNPFTFGKSKAKLYARKTIKTTYNDVAGQDNPKKELQEIIEFLKDPAKFRALGAELPKGVLLVGPPGTGKTLLAKASAGEANVPFFSISGSEFIEMFVGVGASRVRDMFDNAKKDAPSIIFIDELDAIGRARGTGIGGGHDEREQTLNQILSEMDGFTPNESVVVMAATNRPDVLDPALVRPGRFDRQVRLDLPQKKARKQILQLHTRGVPLADNIDFDALAAATVGFSGAELHNLVNEAALLAARKDKKKVEAEDFDQGRDKIIMGLEREDFMNEEERLGVAYHEAGHALVAKLLPGADPIKKVTIIPRGQALGATEQVPEEDRHNITRNYLLDRIAVIMGGRAAEKLVYNETTTGAGDDLKKATQLIRRMVCQWGMSEKIGPVVINMGEAHPFLGREISEPKNFSEDTSRVIDEEIRRISLEMQEKAETLLRENRGKLDALADALVEHETISDEEIDHVFACEMPQMPVI
jgi:cell division protease FtsH